MLFARKRRGEPTYLIAAFSTAIERGFIRFTDAIWASAVVFSQPGANHDCGFALLSCAGVVRRGRIRVVRGRTRGPTFLAPLQRAPERLELQEVEIEVRWRYQWHVQDACAECEPCEEHGGREQLHSRCVAGVARRIEEERERIVRRELLTLPDLHDRRRARHVLSVVGVCGDRVCLRELGLRLWVVGFGVPAILVVWCLLEDVD